MLLGRLKLRVRYVSPQRGEVSCWRNGVDAHFRREFYYESCHHRANGIIFDDRAGSILWTGTGAGSKSDASAFRFFLE